MNIKITKETLITNSDLSVRAINALRANADKFESIKGLSWDSQNCEVTLGHFEGLKKSDLDGFMNMGKKSIVEIEAMFLKAGMVLVGTSVWHTEQRYIGIIKSDLGNGYCMVEPGKPDLKLLYPFGIKAKVDKLEYFRH